MSWTTRDRFTAVYDLHYPSVLAYALTHAGRQAAEDIASETFRIAWRRLREVPEPELPWLLGVARNLVRRHREQGMRQDALAQRGGVAG